MTTIGSILAGAFGQLRDRPVAVLTWAAIYTGLSAASVLAMRPAWHMQALSGPDPDPAAIAQAYSAMSQAFLIQFLLMLVMLFLFTASMRAALRPKEPGFAYLRLGLDEFHVFVIGIIFLGLFFGFYLAMVIVLGVAIAIGWGVAGPVGALIVGGAGLIALLGLLIWFEVRLSLAFPLTVMRRRLVIGEAWQVSRGRFWTLFAAYFLIGLIMTALILVVGIVTMNPYLTVLMREGFTEQSLIAAAEAQMAQSAGITGITVAGWVLGGAIGGLWVALAGGAVATAARELASDGQGVAGAFA